ncbi:hypothetical protein V8G54_019097 [Vigna mungo]|uniref:Retrotransposon gag domain-containing protein n=1 Tax=Vigna mungo TaxID=3915 RepID=A0AAQ3NBD3_VIGMU
MEGKLDGRLRVVENKLEAMEIAVDEIRAENIALHQDTIAIRQDLQEVMRILGGRARDQEGIFDGSQASVNANRRARQEDETGGRDGECGQSHGRWRKRVELPLFEGLDPLNWINRAEKIFKVQGVLEERVRLASTSMEGSAGYWIRVWRTKARNQSWEGLKDALVMRFGDRNRGSVLVQLSATKQMGTVDESDLDFEGWAGQTKRLPEEQLLEYFLASLQEDIGNQVRIQDSQALMVVMRIAREREEDCKGNKDGVRAEIKTHQRGGRV